MKDYIELMMRTAEVKQSIMCEWTCKDAELCNANCEHYESRELVYPPFTAEKQLEIIKLIIKTEGFCGFNNIDNPDKLTISCGFNFPKGPNPRLGLNFNPTFVNLETIEQALSKLTTELMKAGELDKQKIKEVLNG